MLNFYIAGGLRTPGSIRCQEQMLLTQPGWSIFFFAENFCVAISPQGLVHVVTVLDPARDGRAFRPQKHGTLASPRRVSAASRC